MIDGQFEFTDPAGHTAYWPASWKDEDDVLNTILDGSSSTSKHEFASAWEMMLASVRVSADPNSVI